MQAKTTKDSEEIFTKLINRMLPDVLKDYANNIRTGQILTVNSDARTASVLIFGTGQHLDNIKYSRGITGVKSGDTCLVISQDPKLRGQNYIVGIY